YTLAFEGSGGAAGFGKGSSQVRLIPTQGGTQLEYSAKATVGGKLAQVGSRLIDGVARKMTDDFFTRFNAHVAPPAPAEARAVAAAPPRAESKVWLVVILIGLLVAAYAVWMMHTAN